MANRRFRALLADTFTKRMIGLMFRERLGPDTVMLFDFGRSAKYGIWMRNMRFPIDAIWVSDQLRVVAVIRRIGTSEPNRVYKPNARARYLIEASAGFASKNSIKIGTKIKI